MGTQAQKYAYNLTNTKRDLSDAYNDLIKANPNAGVLNLFKVGATPIHTKHEWLERQLSETTTTVASAPSPATSGTSITLTAASGVELYDLLLVLDSSGGRTGKGELMQVTAIGSAPTYTIVRNFGSSPTVTVEAGDIIKIIKPAAQGKLASALTDTYGTAPTANYNYTQIADYKIKIARTALQTATYGITNGAEAEKILDEIAQGMLNIKWQMANSAIYGYRAAASNITTAKGAAGGLFQYTYGGNVISTGGELTYDHLMDAQQAIRADGAPLATVCLCAPNQARKISALNTGGTNPLMMLAPNAPLGNYTQAIQNDLGGLMTIVIDDIMPDDSIFLLNPDFLEVNYLEPLTDIDSTANGDDGMSRIIRTEFTYTIKNGTTAHALLTGLTA